MLWTKAFHIIFLVAWFSGLFYLPRLYVYHADTKDTAGRARFEVMERKLYYLIMTPAAVLTLASGAWLIHYSPATYLQAGWLHAKLSLVLLLLVYHHWLGRLRQNFVRRRSPRPAVFYRWINEIPTVFLVAIVILAVVKPF